MEMASGRQSSGYLMWDYMRSVSLSSTAGNTQVLPTVVAEASNTLTRGQGPQTTSHQKTQTITLATTQPQIQLQIRCSFTTQSINNLTTLKVLLQWQLISNLSNKLFCFVWAKKERKGTTGARQAWTSESFGTGRHYPGTEMQSAAIGNADQNYWSWESDSHLSNVCLCLNSRSSLHCSHSGIPLYYALVKVFLSY